MFPLSLKNFHVFKSCHPGCSHQEAQAHLPVCCELRRFHFLLFQTHRTVSFSFPKSIPGVMSSKAIIFTPEKNRDRVQSKEEREEPNPLLRRLQAHVLLRTSQPQHHPAGPGAEESGGRAA